MPDNQKRGNIDNVIEKAMSRLAGRSPDAVAADEQKERKRLGLGRRDYDQVLADRLEEIRALGRLGQATLPAALPAAAPEPPPPRIGHRTGTLLVAVLLSTIAGATAGAMWFAGPVVARQAAPSEPPVAVAPIAALPTHPEVVEAASVVPAPIPGDEDQVRELIESWRSAWAGRDVDAYLACYGADFTPANGQTRDAWAAARRKNIASRGNIIVATNGLTLERLDAQRMKARFLQDYAAGSYRETAQPKTLLLARGEAGWKIAGEWQGDAPTTR